jgi:hypothetical protein
MSYANTMDAKHRTDDVVLFITFSDKKCILIYLIGKYIHVPNAALKLFP